MFYHFLYPLHDSNSIFNVFKYITLRSMMAFFIACIVSIVWGKYFIDFMRKKQFGQVIREDGPKSHLKKAGTPTMGGIFLLGSVFIASFLTGNFFSAPFTACVAIGISYFLLGYLDDYLKVLKGNTKGVSGKFKLLWQYVTALLVLYFLVKGEYIDTKLYFPFLKNSYFDLGTFYLFFGATVIVGSSNAVNLTDGLDGLAIGPVITSALCLLLLSYIAGHKALSSYLYIPYVVGSGEVSIILSSVIGAGVGFLWYNFYPALVFMGDVGSLSLGGILGISALMSKNSLLFVIIGGVFVIESLSVIIQVFFFKTTGKRIFKMAPIHHHFELCGWPETKVIVRFWIISLLLAIIALATLKLR